MQMDSYNGGPRSMQDLRSYSASSAQQTQPGKEIKIKKNKSSSGSSSKSWSFTDPEMQRKKRVASYKVYAVEGKMKGSLRKSFRWIKDTCTQVVYGWQ
ncbi:putative casein kinase [Hibiscus syriacus]|uniref:Casein kinase n=1 Tax=Hibiscus syriacus TaxID=106335 RepID=A0A6A2XYB6_HIBSY|nr:putative casein kinase [Hibiscus syriacus]